MSNSFAEMWCEFPSADVELRHYKLSLSPSLLCCQFLACWALFTRKVPPEPAFRNHYPCVTHQCSLYFLPPLLHITRPAFSQMLFGHLLPLAAIATAAVKHKPDSDYVFSCGPPLPYLANGSQATSWAQYLDEIGDDLDGDGQGAVDHFGGPIGKAPLKWPRNSDNIAVIPYCYLDEKERESMHEVIEAAIQSWMTYVYIQCDL